MEALQALLVQRCSVVRMPPVLPLWMVAMGAGKGRGSDEGLEGCWNLHRPSWEAKRAPVYGAVPGCVREGPDVPMLFRFPGTSTASRDGEYAHVSRSRGRGWRKPRGRAHVRSPPRP